MEIACGRYLNGSLSRFITESECLDSFSPLKLDVFHALWELYQPPRHRPQPSARSTSSQRFTANRAHALLEVPIGTVVWRDFTDRQGRIQRCRTEVYDYKIPYWGVRHADGDLEKLTRTEIEQERGTSSASTKLTSKVSKKKSVNKLSSNVDACRLSGTGTLPSRTPSVGGAATGRCTGPYLSWSVRSPGFPWRGTHGNLGDRFLPIEMKLDQVRDAWQNDLSISV